MSPNKITEEEVLAAILRGDPERGQAWEYVYKNWRNLWYKILLQAGGIPDEIDEAFSIACLSILKSAVRGTLNLHSATFRTYFVQCVVNAWYSLKGKAAKQANVAHRLSMDQTPGIEEVEEQKIGIGEFVFDGEIEKKELVGQLLKQLSQKCHKILLAYYFEEKSMAAISQIMGFANPHTAQKEKYKCLLKIHAFLKKQPAFHERLKDLKRYV